MVGTAVAGLAITFVTLTCPTIDVNKQLANISYLIPSCEGNNREIVVSSHPLPGHPALPSGKHKAGSVRRVAHRHLPASLIQ